MITRHFSVDYVKIDSDEKLNEENYNVTFDIQNNYCKKKEVEFTKYPLNRLDIGIGIGTICSNNVIKLPSTIKQVTFDVQNNGEYSSQNNSNIFKVFLPPSVEKLILCSAHGFEIAIHKNITHLCIKKPYDSPINLTNKLKHFEIYSNHFDEQFLTLPKNIKIMNIRSTIIRCINFPKNIKVLFIDDLRLINYAVVFPKSLVFISMSIFTYGKTINNIVFPSKLKYLNIYLDCEVKCVLPKHLTLMRLVFGTKVKSLDCITLPESLTHFETECYNNYCIADKLPNSVKYIIFDCNTSLGQKIHCSLNIGNSVTYISLKTEYKEVNLKDVSLSPFHHVKSIYLDIDNYGECYLIHGKHIDDGCPFKIVLCKIISNCCA